jgi:hypothetical protein
MSLHAFHTRPFLGSIPIIIQKQLQDHRIHKPNVARLKQLCCSVPHQQLVLRHSTYSTPQASSPPRGCRGCASRSSCRMSAPLNRTRSSTRLHNTTPRSSAPHGDEQWEKRAYTPNLLGHFLLFVERLGAIEAAVHARLNLSGDGLVWPECLLAQGRIYRVEVIDEAF